MWITLLFIGLTILLGIIVLFQLFVYFQSRLSLRKISEQLPTLRNEAQYGRRLYTDLSVKSTVRICSEINSLIDHYEASLREYRLREQAVKMLISGISHDLRTPTTSLVGYLQMIQKETNPEKKEEYLAILLQAGRKLQYQIDKFYELSKLELGREIIELEEIELQEFVRESFFPFYEEFTSKKLDIKFMNPELKMPVQADKAALGRVLQNLIQNLIRYAYGQIEIDFVEDGGNVNLTITNFTSVPFPEKIENLFEISSYTSTRISSSLGIGLYLCRKLMDEMDASIAAVNMDGRFRIILSFKKIDQY